MTGSADRINSKEFHNDDDPLVEDDIRVIGKILEKVTSASLSVTYTLNNVLMSSSGQTVIVTNL